MIKTKIFLIYDAVLSLDGAYLTVGGIQTYLLSLANVFNANGWDACIVQEAYDDFDKEVNGVLIRGRKIGNVKENKKYKALVDRVSKMIDISNDIVIWGTFYYAVNYREVRSIAIQHGIGFDLIPNSKRNKFIVKMGFGGLIKFFQRSQALRAFSKSTIKVCVDYNFLNWYRTFSLRTDDDQIFVIPNCTDIPKYEICDKQKFNKVLFARRFVEKRGLLLMIASSKSLLSEYDEIMVTFAGEGPLESEIDSLIKMFPGRVSKTKYNQNESLEFHKQFDISVVPTLGSEGTSLSLLEAMASGCAVVCSNVGGMTNIVIDEYNGLMINPNEHELTEAIKSIHLHPELGNNLARAASESVCSGFSKKVWSKKWCSLISEVMSG